MNSHKLAGIFPMMSDEELAGLRADMRANGYRAEFPIWLYESAILDGRNRWRAAIAEGVTPVTREYKGSDPLAFVISANKARRHLTSSQLAFVALEVEKALAVEAKKRQLSTLKQNAVSQTIEQRGTGKASEQAAQMVGTNRQYVTDAKKLQATAPALAEQVKAGTLTIPEAKKQARKDETEKKRADIAKNSAPVAPSDRYRLITANVADLPQHIPAGSVDSIITDPPYPAEFLPVYADLAQAAAKLLKPGAPLVVMIGHAHLPEICALMTPHIKYLWTVAYVTPANTARVFSAKALVNWKPVLVFSNGAYSGEWYADVVNNSAPDKRFHEWGQGESGMAALIERFSAPGQTVLDPFCGGSATGAAAIKLGRRYIGSDLDPASIAISAQRLAGLNGE